MTRILWVLTLALGLTLLFFGGLSAVDGEKAPRQAAPTVRYVAAEGGDFHNDCTDSATACATIQHAVDVAEAADEVRIASGHYPGVSVRGGLTQTVYISKSLTLRGGYTTTQWTEADPKVNPTVLDAQGMGRVMTILGPITVTVEGLEITGGEARGLGGGSLNFDSDSGGGIFVLTATLTLTNSRVYSNTAHDGAGLYLAPSDAFRSIILGNSAFYSNTARGSGGGLVLSYADLQVDRIRVEGNLAQGMRPENPPDPPYPPDPLTVVRFRRGGGGIACIGCFGILANSYVARNETPDYGGGISLDTSYLLLTHNQIVNNAAGQGGGIDWWGGEAEIINSEISKNRAGSGAGMSIDVDSARIDSSSITDNVAPRGNGGIILETDTQSVIQNTLIARNRSAAGGGLTIINRSLDEATTTIANSAIIDNQATAVGSGIYLDALLSRIDLVHVTLARNSDGDGSGLYFTGTIRSDGSVLQPVLAATLWITNSVIAEQNTGLFASPNQRVMMDGVLWHQVGVPTSGPGVYTVTNEFQGDPRFGVDGYHLLAGSAAIDRGIPTAVDTDMDGMLRPYGLAPDLGADEWIEEKFLYLPDIRH